MTQVVRINTVGPSVSLAQAIVDTCEVRESAGLKLRGCFESGGEVILIFQGSLQPDDPLVLSAMARATSPGA